jgi:DNA-binding IclR family transcriptional regulator
VLDKAVEILAALETAPRTLAELAAATGLPRATAHRLAVRMERYGFVRRDAEGRFGLGLRLVGLGQAAADGFPLREIAAPALQRLRDETGESVQLYVAEGDGRRCVVSLPSPHALRWIVAEGALLPMDRGSAGKVLAGGRPHLSSEVSPKVSPEGWAESVEEREPGVASVSAAVTIEGVGIAAAVSVSGPVERLTRRPGRRFGRQVAAAAAEIAAAIARSSR